MLSAALACLSACDDTARTAHLAAPASSSAAALRQTDLLGDIHGGTQACQGSWFYDTDACYQEKAEAPCPPSVWEQKQVEIHLPCRRKAFNLEQRIRRGDIASNENFDRPVWWAVHAQDYGMKTLDACDYLRNTLRMRGEARPGGGRPLPPPFLRRLNDDLFKRVGDAEADARKHADQLMRAHADLEVFEGLLCWNEWARIDSCDFGGKNTFVMLKSHVQCDRMVWNERSGDPLCPLDPHAPWVNDLDRPTGWSTCRNAAFGYEATNVCGEPTTRVVTAFGLSESEARAANSADAYFFSAANQRQVRPTCSTCDALPWGSAQEIRGKYDCLVGQRVSLVAFLEHAGTGSDASKEHASQSLRAVDATLLQLYARQGAREIEAREIYAAVAKPEDTPAMRAAALLDTCTRLADTAELSRNSLDAARFCAAAGNDDGFTQVTYRLANHAVAGLPPGGDGDATDAYGAALEAISVWYWHATASTPNAAAEHEQRLRDVLDKLTVKAAAAPAEVGGLRAAGDILLAKGKVFRVGMAQQELLCAPVLTRVTADALTTLSAHAEDAAIMHDLGCRLHQGGCTDRRDALSQVHAALARLADAPATWAELPETGSTNTGPLADFFSGLAQLEGNTWARITDLAAEARPGTARDIGQIQAVASLASERVHRYLHSGLYVHGHEKILNTGLHVGQRDRLLQYLDQVNRRLSAAKHLVDEQRGLGLGVERERSDSALLFAQIALQMQRLSDDVRGSYAQLHAATTDLAQQRKARGERVAGAAAIETSFWRRHGTTIVDSQSFTVSAAQALALPYARNAQSLPELAITAPTGRYSRHAPWRVQADAGDIVTVSASGAWAPTCALQLASLTHPLQLNHRSNVHVGSALAGSEGYVIHWSDTNFAAQSVDSTRDRTAYQDNGHSYSSCDSSGWSLSATLSASLGAVASVVGTPAAGAAVAAATAIVTESFSGSAGINASVHQSTTNSQCTVSSDGVRTSERTATQNSQGSNSQVSAQYAQGTRLSANPFPGFPTGSLLLVEMPRGHEQLAQARRVYVVQGAIHVPADADADYYLIVNDVRDQTCDVHAEHVLSVSATHQRPSARDVREALATLAAVTHAWENNPPATLQQGLFMPSQAQELYKQAMAKMPKLSTSSSDSHAELAAYIDAELQAELNSLSLRAVINGLRAKIEQDEAQLERLKDEWRVVHRRTRLQDLRAFQAANTVEEDTLRAPLREAVRFINVDLWPILEMRFSGALRQPVPARETLLANVHKLMSLNIVTGIKGDMEGRIKPLEIVAQVAKDIGLLTQAWVQQHGEGVTEDAVGGRRRDLPIFVVNIPRPGKHTDSPWVVDKARAAAFWAALEHPERGEAAALTVDLRDIYAAPECSRLQISDAAPVVHRMAVYAHIRNSMQARNLNAMELSIPMRLSGSMVFPTPHGLEAYRAHETSSLENPSLLLFGADADAKQHLRSAPSVELAGRGGSPFRTFSLKASFVKDASVQSVFSQVDGISLVFELDFQRLNAPMDWLSQWLAL